MSDKEHQVWRIDCREGAVSVTVRRSGSMWVSDGGALGMSPRIAVMAHALRHGIIGTILAPDEPTRADLLARIAELEATR